MIKPYLATREGRYLGLPLGFGFLGASYTFSTIAHISSTFPVNELYWIQLLLRPFAFVFLAFTYYFSNKQSNKRQLWDITLSVIVIALTALFTLGVVAPQLAIDNYRTLGIFVRAFSFACLLYISIHTLRSNLENRNAKTILTPLGFFFLAIGQYSILVWSIESYTAGGTFSFYSGLVFRFVGLLIFLAISYKTFFINQKGSLQCG